MKIFETLWKVDEQMKDRMGGSKYLAKKFYRLALTLSLKLLRNQYEGGLSAFDTISKELSDE